jgi:hypothetical protein
VYVYLLKSNAEMVKSCVRVGELPLFPTCFLKYESAHDKSAESRQISTPKKLRSGAYKCRKVRTPHMTRA